MGPEARLAARQSQQQNPDDIRKILESSLRVNNLEQQRVLRDMIVAEQIARRKDEKLIVEVEELKIQRAAEERAAAEAALQASNSSSASTGGVRYYQPRVVTSDGVPPPELRGTGLSPGSASATSSASASATATGMAAPTPHFNNNGPLSATDSAVSSLNMNSSMRNPNVLGQNMGQNAQNLAQTAPSFSPNQPFTELESAFKPNWKPSFPTPGVLQTEIQNDANQLMSTAMQQDVSPSSFWKGPAKMGDSLGHNMINHPGMMNAGGIGMQASGMMPGGGGGNPQYGGTLQQPLQQGGMPSSVNLNAKEGEHTRGQQDPNVTVGDLLGGGGANNSNSSSGPVKGILGNSNSSSANGSFKNPVTFANNSDEAHKENISRNQNSAANSHKTDPYGYSSRPIDHTLAAKTDPFYGVQQIKLNMPDDDE